MFCIEITEGALIYNMVHYVDFVGVFCTRNSLLKILFLIRSPALGVPLDQV